MYYKYTNSRFSKLRGCQATALCLAGKQESYARATYGTLPGRTKHDVGYHLFRNVVEIKLTRPLAKATSFCYVIDTGPLQDMQKSQGSIIADLCALMVQ